MTSIIGFTANGFEITTLPEEKMKEGGKEIAEQEINRIQYFPADDMGNQIAILHYYQDTDITRAIEMVKEKFKNQMIERIHFLNERLKQLN